jgi:hypothetical protein
MFAKIIEHSRPRNDYDIMPSHLTEGSHEIGHGNRESEQQAIQAPEEHAGRRMQPE